MAPKSTIVAATGIAVTHRPKDERGGDFRQSDQVRAAMEQAAAEAHAKRLPPAEMRAAILDARRKIQRT